MVFSGVRSLRAAVDLFEWVEGRGLGEGGAGFSFWL